MTRVGVARLDLTVDRAELVPLARFRLEEALRLGVEDDGVRLTLIHRLALGRLSGRALRGGEWTARIEARTRGLAAGALHALSPGAAAAEAVFFRSELEARTALAALLATGRRPQGWFWQLALPVWSGASWTAAAPTLLQDLVAQPGGTVALARLVVRTLHDNTGRALLAPLSEGLARMLWPELARAEAVLQPPDGDAGAVSFPYESAARRALEPLSLGAAALLGQLLFEAAALPSRRRLLAAFVVLAQAPHALAAPGVLTATADAVLVLAAPSAPPDAMAALAIPAATADAMAPDAAPPVPDPGLIVAFDTRASGVVPARQSTDQIDAPIFPSGWVVAWPAQGWSPARNSPPAERVPTAGAFGAIGAALPGGPISWPWDERRSEAAGLYLLIRPLALLGLPRWLERHPYAAAEGFGWALLRAIAKRMRIPAEDALWSLLLDDVADTRPDALGAWRVGLDRWLRRRTGCTLATVARRRGWLSGDETTVVARFPLAAADIRLRRLALDVDPGWVPWLGRSVVFVYRDRTDG
jgi:hypothetical protein